MLAKLLEFKLRKGMKFTQINNSKINDKLSKF